MKKWLLGLLVVLAVSFFDLWPFPQQDAGELYIVETLLLEAEENQVHLYAGELSASGANIEEALSAMEENTPGQLFLRQTRRLIFCDGAERNCNPMDLPEQLPMGVCVYTWSGAAEALDMENINKVLEARERRNKKTPTLAKLKNDAITGQPLVLATLEQEENHEGV